MSSCTGELERQYIRAKKKNYTQLGAQNEEKKIETNRATVDRRNKRKKRINKVRTTGRCIKRYTVIERTRFIY